MSAPSPLLIVDWQHVGKPGVEEARDRGAAYQGRIEAVYTLGLLDGFLGACLERDWGFFPLCSGWYPDRHRQANDIAAKVPLAKAVYLALHWNSAEGTPKDRSLVFFDTRSRGGKALAESCVAVLSRGLPEIGLCQAIGAAQDGPWENAWNTIKGVYTGRPVGLCLEPGFLQSALPRLHTREGQRAYAGSICDGIALWARP